MAFPHDVCTGTISICRRCPFLFPMQGFPFPCKTKRNNKKNPIIVPLLQRCFEKTKESFLFLIYALTPKPINGESTCRTSVSVTRVDWGQRVTYEGCPASAESLYSALLAVRIHACVGEICPVYRDVVHWNTKVYHRNYQLFDPPFFLSLLGV